MTDASFEKLAPAVLGELEQLHGALLEAEAAAAAQVALAAPEAQPGARNLVHYLALRRYDLRPLQHKLSVLGLSSLGRSEARVLASLESVMLMLQRALGMALPPERPAGARALDLDEHTRRLLGAAAPPVIMVTMPTEAASDASLTRDLLAAGMRVMRVNCAHDSELEWRAMVAHLRAAEAQLGISCKVLFDLAGPKLRTLHLAPGVRVLRVQPLRDVLGRTLAPGRVTLRAAPTRHAASEPEPGEIWMPRAWLRALEVGETLRCSDARGRQCTLRVAARDEDALQCEALRTTYLSQETQLYRQQARGPARGVRPVKLRAQPMPIELFSGDGLWLTAAPQPGTPTRRAPDGRVLEVAKIACSLPALIAALEPGAAVLFDDGKIGAVVERTTEQAALLRITHAKAGGSKLRADRGINVPGTELAVPALDPEDLAALAVAKEHADMVGLSFTRSAQDVRQLHEQLAQLGADTLAVVLKIETQAGFENLPSILLEALKRPPLGVMIARGDLAVECGFERLAELQEEILWLCEAAQVPAIWATQVLESLAKKGQATRAEITDAAMAERAECVMLNKGPFVREAVTMLSDILTRMRGHQAKKRSMLRPLRSPRFTEQAAPQSHSTIKAEAGHSRPS